MRKFLLILGAFSGILFSVWDNMVSFADTAPLDQDFGIEIISWPFFISKTFIYMVLGSTAGFLSSALINFFSKSKRNSRIKTM